MEEQNKKNKSFVGGALILGAVGIVIKVLGAAFRIPLTNIIGDDGMGYYQTAYPIYNLFLTIATAGIPTAIARMVAERSALDRPREAHKVFRVSATLLSLTGLTCACILFFGAGFITKLIKEPEAVYSMRAIAPALFFCPLMASFRGYFQGRQNMRPTAVSQLVEQLFRVGLGLGLAVALLSGGTPKAAAGASFGATAGGVAGFVVIGLIYLRNRRKILAEFGDTDVLPQDGGESASSILKDILVIAIPITIGSAVLPIINAIDTAIVKSRLIDIGYDSDTARALYGQLTGMAAPLINFPQVLTQAVSISMVPLVASAHKRGETGFLHDSIRLSLRYAMILSVPCAIGMSVLAKPIMLLLYPYQRASAVNAAGCLAILAFGIIFLGLIHALTGILQGVGKQLLPVRNLCIGALCKIVVTYTLTRIPALNVYGAACGTLTAYLVAAVLDLLSVVRHTGAKIDLKLTVLKPLLASAVMGACAYLAQRLLSGVLGNAVSTLAAIVCGVIVYLACVLLTKTVSLEELERLPKGRLLVRVLRRLGAR